MTGVLTGTSRPAAVAGAVRAALDLAAGPAQEARARRLIAGEFTVRSMSAALSGIYSGVTEPAGRA